MHFGTMQHRLIAHLRSRVRSGELTERGAARLTGISQPHLHNVLKGTRLLSPEMADQVLRTLKLCLLDLLDPQELRAYEERSDSRHGAVPWLEGTLGPGQPFPRSGSAWQRFPFLHPELDSLVDPALVQLADDPVMRPLFRGGDVALLDRSSTRRREPDREGCYAIDTGAGGVVRRVRFAPGLLCLAGLEAGGPPGDSITLGNRNILEVVRAKIVWIGRNLEQPLASRPTVQTG